MLEVGVSVWVHEARASEASIQTYHYIIEENEYLCNGKYVPNHRDWFMYCDQRSIGCSLDEAMHSLSQELQNATYLVGHALKGDLEVLRKLKNFKKLRESAQVANA